jgi:uncharacterized protein with HEPN domain
MCIAAAELVGRGRAAVEDDPLLWMALERIIEVAGEAATQLDEATREQYPQVKWRELIGTRVVLAHAYHRVDLDLLWDIASQELPKLADALGPVVERPPESPGAT